MAVCRKCNTMNEEGLTHCRSCNAILPVKIGSSSATRWERVRRQPELVGMPCPSCGVVNPYTRFRCSSCGALLAQPKPKSRVGQLLVFAAIAVIILGTILLVLVRTT